MARLYFSCFFYYSWFFISLWSGDQGFQVACVFCIWQYMRLTLIFPEWTDNWLGEWQPLGMMLSHLLCCLLAQRTIRHIWLGSALAERQTEFPFHCSWGLTLESQLESVCPSKRNIIAFSCSWLKQFSVLNITCLGKTLQLDWSLHWSQLLSSPSPGSTTVRTAAVRAGRIELQLHVCA